MLQSILTCAALIGPVAAALYGAGYIGVALVRALTLRPHRLTPPPRQVVDLVALISGFFYLQIAFGLANIDRGVVSATHFLLDPLLVEVGVMGIILLLILIANGVYFLATELLPWADEGEDHFSWTVSTGGNDAGAKASKS